MLTINNKNSHNTFTGTFRIKPSEIKAKNEIPMLFAQGRQIFHDILEKGDEVIILRDHYDKRVAKYITENNITNIEYYPEINTKSGLDDEKPEKLLEMLKDKTIKVVNDIKEIGKISASRKFPPKKPKMPKISKEIDKISNALRLNIENYKITSNSSLTRVIDSEKRRTIEIIMPQKSISYVYVKPDSLNEDSIKCIIDSKGNIVKTFETPSEIHKFLKMFQELKKQNVNILK